MVNTPLPVALATGLSRGERKRTVMNRQQLGLSVLSVTQAQPLMRSGPPPRLRGLPTAVAFPVRTGILFLKSLY